MLPISHAWRPQPFVVPLLGPHAGLRPPFSVPGSFVVPALLCSDIEFHTALYPQCCLNSTLPQPVPALYSTPVTCTLLLSRLRIELYTGQPPPCFSSRPHDEHSGACPQPVLAQLKSWFCSIFDFGPLASCCCAGSTLYSTLVHHHPAVLPAPHDGHSGACCQPVLSHLLSRFCIRSLTSVHPHSAVVPAPQLLP